MKRRIAALTSLGIAGMIVVTAFGGCSLGLDESLINADAIDANVLPDVGAIDAPIDAPRDAALEADAADAGGDSGACASDSDCTSTNGCLTGRCDLTKQICAYDLCPTTACHASACNATSHTCSAPTAYGFHATSIHVKLGAVGCSGQASRCMAASYPFLFVGTTNGVVGYAMNDPTNASPDAIPVTGLPFLPNAIVASGARVYFVGAVAGNGPTYKVPLAWIDVPTDAQATTLTAHTVLQSFAYPSVSQAYAAPNGALFLVYGDPAKFFPVATVTAPLLDLDTLKPVPSAGIPSGAFPIVASASRLLTYRWSNDSGVFNASFSLETNVGTANAQNLGESSMLSTMGPTFSQAMFTQGADGSVLWSAPSTIVTDAGDPLIRAARLAWLVADGSATAINATNHIDLETYSPPLSLGIASAGPIAWLDASTALALAAAPGAQGQTSVQVVKKTPSPSIVPDRRYVLPNGVSALGATSSNGFAYVLAADAPDGATLHVFAPACSL